MDRIEHHEGGGISFVGCEAVNVFKLATLISALEFEHKTGMKMSRHISALAAAKRITGLKTNDRTKHIARVKILLENAQAQVLHVNTAQGGEA
jgi:hypothetical protein